MGDILWPVWQRANGSSYITASEQVSFKGLCELLEAFW